MIGGISTTRKIAAMVEADGQGVHAAHLDERHRPGGEPARARRPAPNVPYIEFPYDPPNWTPETRDFIFAEPLRIDAEGYVPLPQKPGLGIELDEEKLAKYEQKDTSRLI